MQQESSAPPPLENQIAQLMAALRRRRWPFLAALVCGVLLTLFVALVWPATYRSMATIYVEPSDMTAQTDAAEELPARQIARVTQRVLTTEKLAPLLREVRLYDSEDLSLSERVDKLQQNFTLEQFTAESVDSRGRPTESVVTFSLAFDDPVPTTAQRVVGRLVSLYERENILIRESRFSERARFLGSEAGRIEEQIQALEQQLAQFRAVNEGSLPGSYESNSQLLARVEAARLETDRRLAAQEQRIIYLRAELATVADQLAGSGSQRGLLPREQLVEAESQLRLLSSRYGESHPDVVAMRRQVEALQRAIESGRLADEGPELASARAELAAARERYTDNHPEVVRLQQQVAELESQAAQAGGADELLTDTEIRLRADLATAIADVNTLQTSRQEQTRQIAELEAAISRLPQVELNYSTISRDLSNLQSQYQSVKAQELDARVAQQVEEQRRGQRFVTIEDPSLPFEPYSPNRGAILFLGLVMSLFLAIFLAATLEALDSTVRGRNGVIDVFGDAPLASIPVIGATPAMTAGARSQVALLTAAGVFAALLIGLALVHVLIVELPTLWGVLTRSIGL
ncbi:MAG: hypothetical protein AAF184_03275 [Pseudomonadota bacterium]